MQFHYAPMCAEVAPAPQRGGNLLHSPVGRSPSLSHTAGERCSQEIGRLTASNHKCPGCKSEDASEGRSAPLRLSSEAIRSGNEGSRNSTGSHRLAVSACWTNSTSPMQDLGAGVSSMNSSQVIESFPT
jgi:hypothetical protein